MTAFSTSLNTYPNFNRIPGTGPAGAMVGKYLNMYSSGHEGVKGS